MTAATRTGRSARLRLRLAAAAVGLVPWFALPGRTVADTKIDLVVDPWGYLARATSAWDPHAFFGQLQNQAYGYLFPMGPFFGVTRSFGIPEWACQRLWWSLVLVVGFLGMYCLIRRWGLAGSRIALVVALAYALSPRVLTVLGSISIEAWPSALVPWLVIGADRLLRAQDGPNRRRRAAMLGLLVASIGGVNATATIAALAVPSVYLLAAGRTGARAFAWWAGVVALATAWWAIPLAVLGKYAYPFLDFIESSSTTTRVTSVPNVLRGTSHWIAYIPFQQSGGEWPAGAMLATSGWLVFATMALAVLGLAGLLQRQNWTSQVHVRRFAILSVLLGVTVMSVGFGAALDGPFVSPFAADVRSLLDGSLSAFRNVHKFDPLVRLPLCLGLASLLGAVNTRKFGLKLLPKSASGSQMLAGQLLVFVPMLVLVVSAVSPAAQLDLAPRGSFKEIPARWHQASEVVDQLAARDGGSTLVAPASRYGSFTWGTTQDNPLEVLANSQVVNRSAIPLGDPGAIRVIDALDGMLTAGGGDPSLIDVLDRLGISRVVVPHDNLEQLPNDILSPTRPNAPTLTETTLKASGLSLVRSWGKGNTALSLWSTGRPTDRVDLYDAKSVVNLTGGPEAIVGLAEAGLLGPEAPAYMIGEDKSTHGWIQTDTLRKRVLSVAASVRDEYSATLQRGEIPETGRVADDFPPADTQPNTVRGFRGIENVSSSSTASDPYGVAYRGATAGVASAFDADFDTAWLSEPGDDKPEISFDLTRKTRVGSVEIQLADGNDVVAVKEVEIDIDGDTVELPVVRQSTKLTIPVNRRIGSIRVRLVPKRTPSGSVGVANIAVVGLDAGTGLQLPIIKAAETGSVLVARGSGAGGGEQSEDGRVLTRYFNTASPLAVGRVYLRPLQTPAVERLIDGWTVSGPRLSDDLTVRPGAALDKDPSTRWTVGFLAADPQLRVGWDEAQSITGISGIKLGGSSSTAISKVTIEDPDTGESRFLKPGSTTFKPLKAKRVIVTLALPSKAVYPFRVPDFTLTGARPAPASEPGTTVEIPCTDGARMTVGGTTGTYTAEATRSQLLQGARLEASRCDGQQLKTSVGENVLRGESSGILAVDTVFLGSEQPARNADAATGTARVIKWGDRKRVLNVDGEGAERILALHEGFNGGWKAKVGGVELETVEVDGWRQGFYIPKGTDGPVVLTFSPDATYRGGLALGAGLLVVLAVMAFRPARRSRSVKAARPHRPRRTPGRVISIGLGAMLGGVGGIMLGLAAAFLPRQWRFRIVALACVGLALVTIVWVLPEKGVLQTFIPQGLGLFLICALAAELSASVGPTKDGGLYEAPGNVRDEDRHGQREYSGQDK